MAATREIALWAMTILLILGAVALWVRLVVLAR